MQDSRSSQSEGNTEKIPEGGYGWFVVLGVFLVVFILRGSGAAMGLLLVAFVDYFDADAGTVSWITSMYMGLLMAAGPVAAALCKRFGHRRLCFVGGAISFASLVLASFSSNIWQLILTVGVITGLASSLAATTATPFLAYYFKKRHALANGLAMTAVGFGSIVIPLVIQYCLENYGWKGTLLVFAALYANICVGASFFRLPRPGKSQSCIRKLEGRDGSFVDDEQTSRERNVEDQDRSFVDDERASGDDTKRKPLTPSSGRCGFIYLIRKMFDCSLFTSEPLFVIFLIGFVMVICVQILSTMYLAPLMYSKGLPGQHVALLISLYGAGGIASGPLGGILFVRLEAAIRPLGIAFILFGIFAYLEIIPISTTSFAILNTILGFFSALTASQSLTALRQVVGLKRYTSAVGLCLFFGGFTQLAVTPLGGYLRDYTGNYKATYILAGSIGVCSGLLLIVGSLALERREKLDSKSKNPEQLAMQSQFQ